MSPEKAKLIADYFGVSLDYLMTGLDNDKKEPQLLSIEEENEKKIMDTISKVFKRRGIKIDGSAKSQKLIDNLLKSIELTVEVTLNQTGDDGE